MILSEIGVVTLFLGLLATLVLIVTFYRKDTGLTRDRLLGLIQKQSSVLEHLDVALGEHHRSEMMWFAKISDELVEIRHAVNRP